MKDNTNHNYKPFWLVSPLILSSEVYSCFCCPNAQDKIITTLTGSAVRLADKNMSMSGPLYMHASIVTPGLAANHCPGNGLDHLRIVERPDVHIIFRSSCSSQYLLWRVIRHVNYTHVHYTTEIRQFLTVIEMITWVTFNRMWLEWGRLIMILVIIINNKRIQHCRMWK